MRNCCGRSLSASTDWREALPPLCWLRSITSSSIAGVTCAQALA